MMEKGRKGRNFIKPLMFGILLCLAFVGVSYLAFYRYTEKDEAEYRHLMLISNPTLAENKEILPYTARQKRIDVQKDFTYMREEAPLKIRMYSREAELIFERQEKTASIIEEMLGIRIFMQEELYYLLPDGREVVFDAGNFFSKESALEIEAQIDMRPMQVLRYLEANSGSYSYNSKVCKANHVIVERYIEEGHELPKNVKSGQLIFRGMADSVEFKLSGGEPEFTAMQMKASIMSPGKL